MDGWMDGWMDGYTHGVTIAVGGRSGPVCLIQTSFCFRITGAVDGIIGTFWEGLVFFNATQKWSSRTPLTMKAPVILVLLGIIVNF